MKLGIQRRPSWERCFQSGDLNDEGRDSSPLASIRDLRWGELGADSRLEKARARGENNVVPGGGDCQDSNYIEPCRYVKHLVIILGLGSPGGVCS